MIMAAQTRQGAEGIRHAAGAGRKASYLLLRGLKKQILKCPHVVFKRFMQ